MSITPEEAAKLFTETSQALRENNETKLNELMEVKEEKEVSPDPVEKEQTEETPPEEKEDKETPTDDTDSDKDSEEPEEKKEGSPPEKADKSTEKEEQKEPKEQTEVEKLLEQITKLERQNHDLKSQAGRVPSMQRKIREIDKKLEELSKKETSPSSQLSTKMKPRVLELLKGIGDTDPDLAKAVADAIGEAMDGVANESVAKEKETLQFLRLQEQREYQAQQAEALLEMYPNARDVFKSDSWSAWKAEQTAGIRNLAESDTASEVADALERYARDMIAKHPELAPKVEQPKKEEVPLKVDAGTADKARRIEEERNRKKETSANVGSPNPAGRVQMPDDPQALFNKFTEEIRKQRLG